MPASVSALFATKPEAQAAADRLSGIGVDRSKVTITDQSQGASHEEKAGFFDQLAGILLSEDSPALAPSRQGGFLLTAEVEPERLDQAASLIETGAITSDRPRGELREQLFEFTETAEELVIGKEHVVREEIVLRKEAEEHVEEVHGTVRHTEVEIEKIPPEPIRFGGRTELLRGSGFRGNKG